MTRYLAPSAVAVEQKNFHSLPFVPTLYQWPGDNKNKNCQLLLLEHLIISNLNSSCNIPHAERRNLHVLPIASGIWLSLLLRDLRYIEPETQFKSGTRKMAWIIITQDDKFLHERKCESLFP